jgi:hypothetical protein
VGGDIMSFTHCLQEGIVGETKIANFFKSKGYSVLPVYEVELDTGKGPRLFTPKQPLIAPDMVIYKGKKCYWIEAKHKTAFTWHRITNRWTTGIDLKHYGDYCKIDDNSPWPIWLLFLHKGGQAKDSPPSPSGLFGNTLTYLRKNENHRSDKWGKYGMVYWAKEKLKLFTEDAIDNILNGYEEREIAFKIDKNGQGMLDF